MSRKAPLKRCLLLLCVGLVLAGPIPAIAEEPALAFDAEQVRFFEEQARPVLEAHCFKCHGGGDRIRGDLDLTTRSGALKGGAFGPAIDLEEPEFSTLLEAINFEGLEMPPTGKISQAEIDILHRWIQMGAPYSGDSEGKGEVAMARPEAHGPPRVEDHRDFWSFQPVKRPAVPEVEAVDRVRNPIDAFWLHRLEAAGLTASPTAGKVALIRRAYQDLTGLPPTPEEVDAFRADESPDAYERIVDRLLDSPQYGERWGRHWLDLVRFAETNSFERDRDKPNTWRYRDYIIASFNADKPFDQFIREQLAGDELDEVTPESIIATGFYRLGSWDDEPSDRLEARYDELDDIITTTAQGFLGLTLNCARCHDHKIDPIPQTDYYRFLGFFHNLKPYSYDENSILTSIASAEEQTEHDNSAGERRDREEAVNAELNPLEAKILATVPEPRQSNLRKGSFDGRRHALDGMAGEVLDDDEQTRYRRLIRQFRAIPPVPPLPKALSAREAGPEAPETFLLIRGNAHAKGEKVEPGFPEVLGAADPSLPTPDPGASSSGRRRALADWIASPDNPLTARVAVNRIWQHHFGRGIVRSSNDFGLQGDPPTHPELLDWLAHEFVAQGWRLKPIHRLIMTSAAYQMSSIGNPEALAADPSNDLYWRFDMRRLQAEEIRDAILAVNGRLNRKMGGPGIYPEIPPAYLASQSKPGDGWGKSSPTEQARRSVYIHVKRSLITPILADFDVADTDATCPSRFATTQPTQALSMINGPFLNDQAQALANRLRQEAGPDLADRVRLALRLATCREPEPAEVDRGLCLIRQWRAEDGANPDKALDLFCLMILNLNEFVYLD
ncbi:PSD1 and planctomycete cytochrome C domain-containing protein [soil metagenome]